MNNVIVGAGSVVTKSISSNSIVGGNSAKIITTIDKFEEKFLQYNLDIKNLDPVSKKNVLLNLSEEKFIKK